MVPGKTLKAGVLFFLCLVFAKSAFAVSFQFRDLPLPHFVQAVFGEVLKRDFVMSPGVSQSTQLVSLVVNDVEPSRVVPLLASVFEVHGVALVERQGVVFLELRPDVAASSGASGPVAGSAALGPVAPVVVGPGGVSALPALAFDPSSSVEVWRPRFRSADFLAAVARFAGASVLQAEGLALDSVVYSVPDDLRGRVEAALQASDVAPLAVRLRAAMIEVTTSDDRSMSLAAVFNLLSGKLGLSFGVPGSAGGAAVSFKNATIDAVLAAVEGDSRFRYVAEPSLRVLDGQAARLMVGSDVPVRGATVVDRSGNPVQDIEYRSAGVQLTVEPRIFRELVVAKVSQEISSFTTTTTSGIDSPTMLKRAASTVVDLKPGELVALAGLDETRETSARSGLSWLPFDFSSSSSNARSQILLFLQADIEPSPGG